jgi:heat shock protein HspQ
MNITTKFEYEQYVRHRLTGFEGYIVGVIVKPHGLSYEV